MFTKNILFIIILSFSCSNLIASEINSSPASADINQKSELKTDQIIQTPQSSSPKKEKGSTSNEQSNADKKPSMIDYCRKHTC